MPFTQEQAAVRDASADLREGDILRVIAFAGAGKTTTLKAIADVRRDKGLYLAFNKPIAQEADRKFRNTRCTARTMHSLAWRATRMRNGDAVRLNAKTVQQIIDLNSYPWPSLPRWNAYRCAAAVARTVSVFCASADDRLDDGHAYQALVQTCGDPTMIRDRHKASIVRDAIIALRQVVATAAEATWDGMLRSGQLSHDAYLKLLDLDAGARGRAFDQIGYILVDEAQDLNPVQRSIVVKTGLPLVAVGDPYQQIYSFRGAENALAQLPGKQLYLTASFRFGESVATQARSILRSRPDGGPSKLLEGARPEDAAPPAGPRAALLARTNAELLRAALNFAAKDIPIAFLGGIEEARREAESAQALHDGNLRAVQSPELAAYDSWDELVMEAEAGNATMARLQKLVEGGMTSQLEQLAACEARPQDARVIFSTAHKAKGCEWPVVMMASDWTPLPALQDRHMKAKTESEAAVTGSLEEWNLLYVAATRAISSAERLDRIMSPEAARKPQARQARRRLAEGRRQSASSSSFEPA